MDEMMLIGHQPHPPFPPTQKTEYGDLQDAE